MFESEKDLLGNNKQTSFNKWSAESEMRHQKDARDNQSFLFHTNNELSDKISALESELRQQ